MRKIIILAFIISPSLFCYSQKASSTGTESVFKKSESIEKNAIGKAFPPFIIFNNETEWSNQKLLGKTVYINFWFSSCVPCMAEMPQLNDLYEKFKGDSNFVFISISFDKLEQINAVKLKHNIRYDIFSVSIIECMKMNSAKSFPASIILDKNGVVIFYETGGLGINLLTTRHFKRKIYPAIENSLNDR